MLNPNKIDPKHLPALQAAILKNGSTLDEHLVSKLYVTAKAALKAGDGKMEADAKTVLVKNIAQAGVVSVTATDADTGLFVALTDQPEIPGLLLTFGKKFAQETRDAMRQNIATRIW